MIECKTLFSIIIFILLLLFMIPIRIDVPAPTNNTMLLFDRYIDKYNKTYKANESVRLQKFLAFQDTMKEIEQLNSKRAHNLSAIFGITKFSDLSKEEFMQKYLQTDMYTRIQKSKLLYRSKLHSSEDNSSYEVNRNRRKVNTLPVKVDWRNKQIVTKVNNQKNCGACWAFSTVETVESISAIKNGILKKLSVQELIDCAGYTNEGCDGGDICTLLYWLYDNKIKIQKEEEYPFHWKTETCKLNRTYPGVQISDFSCSSFVGHEDLLLSTLAYHGPVAVAVNAILWQHYVGGVIHYHCDGSPSLMNHAVQIVGYDTSAQIPYYIVRNSWGKDFGDKGYLYLAIGSNICGLANEVASVDVL